MPDVLSIVPNRRYSYSLTRSNDLMNAPAAWQLTGGEQLAGRGMKIGIIDTGIDHTHVMFDDQGYQAPEGYPIGDTDFTNNKIIVARVFTKGGDSAIDSTPRDRDGHGTHVASCAAGNLNTPSPLGSISGFAPNAYLGNYKVFTSSFTTLEQIIGALEACVEDGMDVVNLSLGSEAYINPLLDPEALAIRNAIKAGVVVVAAAGNSGAPETIGSPGQIPEVITVGSLTNGHAGASSGDVDIAMMNVYSDGKQILTDEQVVLGPDPEFFSHPLLGRFQIVDADLLDGGRYGGDPHGLACRSLPAGSAQESWVLAQRGTCSYAEKIFNVEDAGGWGALIYNNAGAEEGPDELIRGLVPGTMLPSYFSSRNVGLAVKEALAGGGVVEVEFYAATPHERNQTPLELSIFSSAGPSLSYVIKPEISAIGEGSYGATQNDLPGEYRFSSIDYTSFDLSGFGFSSGTSFSSPRVAGVAALIKQANPSWAPEEVKSAIVISAQRPANFTPLSGMERGAGHVDAVRSMDLPLIVTPATLSWENLLIDEVTKAGKRILLKNVSQQFQSVSLTLGLPTDGCLQVIEMSPDKVDLAPSESVEVSIDLTFSPPAELGQIEDISGDVMLEITGESEPLRVPAWARIMNVPPAQGTILLIDDDGGESIETQYINAVNRAGYEATSWDVAQLEAYPSAQYMERFQAVSWFLATTSLYNITDGVLGTNERVRFNVALTKYLARGGRLLVSGQDWSDDQEETLFGQQVLHIWQFTHDPFVQYTQLGEVDVFEETLAISGVPDSPIAEGITNLYAEFDDAFVNMSDLLVLDETGLAKPALIANKNPQDLIGITIETDSYRAVFFSFGLERIDPGGRTRDGMDIIVRNSLDWLMGGSSTRLAIRSVEPQIQFDNNATLKVTLTTEGVNFPVGHDVRLNEQSVEITSIDVTGNLEILIPAGLPGGLYDITLTSPDGQIATLSQAFQVEESELTILGP
jgi:subtilisin family serine protease